MGNCVVIETLWNVKENYTSFYRWAIAVVIETLWNVKVLMPVIILNRVIVVIETLWNVKNDPFKYSCGVVGCNRDIVECKGIYGRH